MADPDAGDPDTAWFEQPKDLRTLQVLAHVMMNLRDLVRWACEESPLKRTTLTFPVYIACVEAFFTNARLAAEFFWRMPAQDLTDTEGDDLSQVVSWLQEHLPMRFSAKHWKRWTPTRSDGFKGRQLPAPAINKPSN